MYLYRTMVAIRRLETASDQVGTSRVVIYCFLVISVNVDEGRLVSVASNVGQWIAAAYRQAIAVDAVH